MTEPFPKSNIPMTRRDRLLRIADAISPRPLAAKLVSKHQALLYPRIDADGNTACVSVANCTVGKLEDGELLIRSPRSESFVFISQQHSEMRLEAEKREDGYLVKLPSLDAWTAATVFCI